MTFILAGVGSGPAARRDGLLLGTPEHLMTFADPYLLAALVLVPLAVIVYVVFAQRSRRAARAAANPALWPNLMPRRPGWRRHVPPALLLLALGLLLVGAARPQAMMASDQKETTVVLTVDTSNSMAATDVHPSRIAGRAHRGAGSHQRPARRTRRSASSRSRATCTSLLAPTDDRNGHQAARSSASR